MNYLQVPKPFHVELTCSRPLYLQEASAEFYDSFLEIPSQQMARIAADPGGSRVMEALLESPASAKLKKKLLKKLQGYYATIATVPAGNFLVEKCYSFSVKYFQMKRGC